MRRIEHNADTSSHSLRRKVLSEDSADLQKGNKDIGPWERNDNEWNSHQNSMSRREEKETYSSGRTVSSGDLTPDAANLSALDNVVSLQGNKKEDEMNKNTL